MKRLLLYILIPLMLAAAVACRTNNGEIGPLYGQWALQSLYIDGHPSEIPCSLFSIRFQNNIVCITERHPFNDFTNSFGTWEMAQNELTLNFSHTTADSIFMSHLPDSLLIPNHQITTFHVDTLTHTTLRLSRFTPTDIPLTYTFKKLY